MLAIYIAVPAGIGGLGIIVGVYFLVLKIKADSALSKVAIAEAQTPNKIASTPQQLFENNLVQDLDLEEARHGIRSASSDFDSRNTT
jgi:hypothetical protein